MKMEWNAGGWFGGQLGGTVWILVAAALSAFHDVSIGGVLLGLFLVPNIVGYLFWRTRWWSCYAATQWLIGLMGICGLLAVYVLDRGSLWLEIQTGGSGSAQSGYFIVGGVFALMMLVFYVRFGRRAGDSAS